MHVTDNVCMDTPFSNSPTTGMRHYMLESTGQISYSRLDRYRFTTSAASGPFFMQVRLGNQLILSTADRCPFGSLSREPVNKTADASKAVDLIPR